MSFIPVGELSPKMENIRDAIHVPVAQVEAVGILAPGQRIRFYMPGSRRVIAAKANEASVGVVDCFLSQPVKEGEIFWMFLYPNTISALHHRWTHPELPEKDDQDSYYNDDPECRSMGCD